MIPGVTIRFVATGALYSIYRTRDGKPVYLAHGTGRQLFPLAEIDLASIWAQFSYRDDCLDEIRAMTITPDCVDDEIAFCDDCDRIGYSDDYSTTGNGDRVCKSCCGNYYYCEDCEGLYRETWTTVYETEVCEYCRDAHFTYCEECAAYRRDADDDHYHNDDDDCDGNCESPAMAFTMRNDGDAPLPNDTPTTVTLPAGVISAEGIGAIAAYLREWSYSTDDTDIRHAYYRLSYSLETLGDKWQTRDGNYTKRLSRLAYKSFGLKVPAEVISRVGCIGSDHSRAVDFEIEMTRNLNLSAAAFGHADSCFWQSYRSSRCTLKTNGGIGIRSFADSAYGRAVTGRAWIIPLRQSGNGALVATFNALSPDAFVVFNGYGALSGYAAARIVAHMAGMTYRKVTFSVGEVYVNSSVGYVVAPEEIANNYDDGSLYLDADAHSDLFSVERMMAHV